ncbi:MAG: type II toxin-antitoxin system HicA family toxin [Desulfacinum sp.]|jgi:predicted RNA binding protein YcfA (HicA-like mRNA interferase family)|nr:type II toxin-antitoxin system HicA family toxin [Desulfacinum sp.]
MGKQKLLGRLLRGSKNIRFLEVQSCLEALGFKLARVKGSHHIYVHPDVPEILNIQNVDGKAKPYQVRQILRLIEKYGLQVRD